MICPICKRDVVKLIYKPNREPGYQCDECDANLITTAGLFMDEDGVHGVLRRASPEIIFKGEGWTKKGVS